MDNQYWLSIPYFVVTDEVDGEKERGKQEKQSLSEKETGNRGERERDDDKQTHAPCTLNPRD